jgi:chemotaxis protein methyltransferase CheR
MMSSGNGRKPSSFGFGTNIFALTDASFMLLRDLIAERTGMFFDEGKRSLLADKLSELVSANGLSSFLDYYYLLRYDDASEQHWMSLMDRLSVPETFLWRQPEQFEALASIVVPAHFAAYPGRTMRIWSAACCTGEEALSIAIALDRAGLLEIGQVEIHATDGSSNMVERAKQATYSARSFRQLPENLKAQYFEQSTPDRWRPIERLMRHTSFGVANLARRADIEPLARSDVIFCRNVFIYFADDAIRSVVRVFSERMPADGVLFLGASESLTRLGVDLELAEIGKSFAYVKEGRRQIIERWRSPAAEAHAPAGLPTTKGFS